MQPTVGGYEPRIHYCRNRLKGRVATARKGGPNEYNMFNDKRKEFAANAAGLFGAELKAAMDQQLDAAKSKRKSAQFKEEGDYVLIEDAMGLPP